MKLIFSFDDYSEENYKLAELLKKYNLAKFVIWFIDLTGGGKSKRQIEKFAKDFQIGSHTIAHTRLTECDEYLAFSEIFNSKEFIESWIKRKIEWFCYPRGWFNEKIKKMVKDEGYKYARTTKVLQTDWDDPYERPTTIHIYPRKEYEGRDWLELAKEYFEKAKEENSEFHLWGHSWEINKLRQWDRLDKFLKYLDERRVNFDR